ncbi:MAG: threonine ammonia-lyase [Chitinophagales bacterium]
MSSIVPKVNIHEERAVDVLNIIKASHRLNGIAVETPLQRNENLSDKYSANVFLKREDLQVVRSYKIRGAYNLMSNLTEEQAENGVVCASAGNHAQGFAYSCRLLGIHGKVYMPTPTPSQKIKRVVQLGKEMIEVVLVGDTFDDASAEALTYAKEHNKVVIPPFNHPLVIEGNGTVGYEILEQFNGHIDYLFLPIGGGGISSGVGTYMKSLSPNTKIIGVEPEGAPAMWEAFRQDKVVTLQNIDTFVDGAAVKRVGELNFGICKKVLDAIQLVPEGKICTFILDMYNDDAIVVEPAGALGIAAMDFYKEEIKGKNVVCLVSGGNNDIQRMPEIRERSLIYEGIKHYFIINFPQRAGALREFLDKVLGPNDSIAHFEYAKKNNRVKGPALVGIELEKKENYEMFLQRMNENNIEYTLVNENPSLFNYLI